GAPSRYARVAACVHAVGFLSSYGRNCGRIAADISFGPDTTSNAKPESRRNLAVTPLPQSFPPSVPTVSFLHTSNSQGQQLRTSQIPFHEQYLVRSWRGCAPHL